MSDKSLNRLKKLISSLRAEERSLALKHLGAYDTHGNSGKTKMKKLCKVILKDSDIEYVRLKQMVSPHSNESSFNQLLKRTFNRLKESLILDVNILRKGNYGKIFQKKFLIRKQIVEAQIISGRGLVEESLRLINKLIQQAKKYELYDELIELLRIKQDKIVNLKGIKAYHKIGKEIAKYERIRTLSQEARDTLNVYYSKINFSANQKGNVDLMKETYVKLQSFADQSESVNVQSLAYLISLEYYSQIEDFDTNYKMGMRFLDLVRSEELLRSRPREAYILNNLIRNQMNAYKFNSALEFADEAESILTSSKTNKNLYNVLVYKIFLHFYKADYEQVLNYLNRLEDFPIAQNELQSTQLFYYKAMRYFALEEYRQANLLLRNMPLLEKDKEGWNVWLRIMRILSSIELLRLELIDYDLANFRKYMQRIRKAYELNKRHDLILKVLSSLDRNDFDFKKVAEINATELELLKSNQADVKWKPIGPEMIIFTDWFESKLEDKPYFSQILR